VVVAGARGSTLGATVRGATDLEEGHLFYLVVDFGSRSFGGVRCDGSGVGWESLDLIDAPSVVMIEFLAESVGLFSLELEKSVGRLNHSILVPITIREENGNIGPPIITVIPNIVEDFRTVRRFEGAAVRSAAFPVWIGTRLGIMPAAAHSTIAAQGTQVFVVIHDTKPLERVTG
jgi:hypothetical protein